MMARAHRRPRRPAPPAPGEGALALDTNALRDVDISRLADEPSLDARVSWLRSKTVCRPWPQKKASKANDYTKELLASFSQLQETLAQTPDMTCIQLRDIFLIGRNSTLYDPHTGAILAGPALGLARDVLQRRKIDLGKVFRRPHPVIRQDPASTYVLIDQPGIKVYGHFLLDVVPKIYIAEKLLAREAKYVLRYYLPWMRDLLATLGIGEERVIVVDDNSVLHFEELYVPLTPKVGYAVNIGVLRATWDHFIDRDPMLRQAAPNPPMGRRLFLSRGNLTSRPRVENEDALYDIARRFDFERICPETLSFADQVQVFSAADHVAGEDGSALHNAIFCTRGRTMITFMRPDRDNLWHIAFARASNMDFHAIKCQKHGDGYAADAEEFQRILKAAVAVQGLSRASPVGTDLRPPAKP